MAKAKSTKPQGLLAIVGLATDDETTASGVVAYLTRPGVERWRKAVLRVKAAFEGPKPDDDSDAFIEVHIGTWVGSPVVGEPYDGPARIVNGDSDVRLVRASERVFTALANKTDASFDYHGAILTEDAVRFDFLEKNSDARIQSSEVRFADLLAAFDDPTVPALDRKAWAEWQPGVEFPDDGQ